MTEESSTYDAESDLRKFKEIIIKQEQELIQLRSDLNYHIEKEDIAISELGKDINDIKNNSNIETKRISKLQNRLDTLQSSSGDAKDKSFGVTTSIYPQEEDKKTYSKSHYDTKFTSYSSSNGINKKGERE